jgi:hypothetical protein
MHNENDLDAEKVNRTKQHQEMQKRAAHEREMRDRQQGPQRPQTVSVFERVDNEELKKLLDVLNENGVSSFELGDLRIQLNGRGSIQKMLEAQAAAEALLASEDKADADGKPKARVKLKQPTDEELLMNPLAGLKLP